MAPEDRGQGWERTYDHDEIVDSFVENVWDAGRRHEVRSCVLDRIYKSGFWIKW